MAYIAVKGTVLDVLKYYRQTAMDTFDEHTGEVTRLQFELDQAKFHQETFRVRARDWGTAIAALEALEKNDVVA